jgi:hypothetical protein
MGATTESSKEGLAITRTEEENVSIRGRQMSKLVSAEY